MLSPDVALAVEGGKSAEEVKSHYELLVEDLEHIESGCVPIPDYGSRDGGTAREERVAMVSRDPGREHR
ncbi:hypothetical protein MLD38_013851 [Melastoma candidum]|uniref:Uncharacterized protein n=1 Tax=Melastoma candidum TaxID=119954 RepID=A0ACB9RBH7_9MYRT|nr:hypothetical protein MLD38_013851 [Melastoma candidum]